MPFKCKICDEIPNSHSFDMIEKIDDLSIFYSCPGDIDNEDPSTIISHYQDTLDEYMGEKWTWIIDSKNYKLKKALHTNSATKIARLISRDEYLNKLQEIIIVKPNGEFKTIIALVWLFLSNNLKEKIKFEY